MPVTVRMEIYHKADDQLMCYLCQEKLHHGERYIHWGIQVDKEFVQCSFHRAPTKIKIGLTVLYSYGFSDTFHYPSAQLYKINKTSLRGRVENPASPSWLNVNQLIELYENPSIDLVTRLINENLHENKYWQDQADKESKVKNILPGEDGIRRGFRVLELERRCSSCGILEADMVAKNPRYTLCRGVCVVCYRKIYRKKKVNAVHV